MRTFACLLLPIALLLAACGSDTTPTPTSRPTETPTLAAHPTLGETPFHTATSEATDTPTVSPTPVLPTATPVPPTPELPTPDAQATVWLMPVPGASIQPGPQSNGRSVSQTLESVDLDGDGSPEQLLTFAWQDPGDIERATLQVEIIGANAELIYSQNTWEPLDDPSTTDPKATPLGVYDRLEAVDLRDLTGNGSPEVIVQRRVAGTDGMLDVTIVQVVGGQAVSIFQADARNGRLEATEDGFNLIEPLYLYHEPRCCPCRSSRLSYTWQDGRFVLEGRESTASGNASNCPSFPQSARWQRIETEGDGPLPRRDAAMAFDRARNRLILFGGRSGDTALHDTWAFDIPTNTWQSLDSEGSPYPPARFSMVSGIDDRNQRMVITTGQFGPNQFLNDVWTLEFATDTWVPLAVRGDVPTSRYGSAGGVFDMGRALYLSHGFTNAGRFDDLWTFDLAAETWTELTPSDPIPLKRCLHAAAMMDSDSFLLFGGCSSDFGPCPQGDTWQWDGALGAWSEVAGTSGATPAARQFPAMATLNDRQKVLLFGGLAEDNRALTDLWAFDTPTGRWSQVPPAGDAPDARDGHSLVWVENLNPAVPGTGYVVLFGGHSDGSDLNDLWMLLPGDL